MSQGMGLGSNVYTLGPTLGIEVLVHSYLVQSVLLGSYDKCRGPSAFWWDPRSL